jgi:hypothetical protein
MQSSTRKEVSFVKDGVTVFSGVRVSVAVKEGVAVGGVGVDVSVAVASRVEVNVGSGDGLALAVDVGVGETMITGVKDLKAITARRITPRARAPQITYLYLLNVGGRLGSKLLTNAVFLTGSPV